MTDAANPIESLLIRARGGDEQALSMLLEHAAADLRRRFAVAIPARWIDQFSVDDLMQQTYLDAFLSIRRLDAGDGDSFSAWLSAIARRNLQDALRTLEADKRGGSRRTASLDAATDGLEPLLDEVTAVSLTPSRFVARNETIARLREAIGALPSPHREVVNLYDLDGQSMADVAAEIGRTVGTAYMLRARALGWLAEMLGGTSFSIRTAG